MRDSNQNPHMQLDRRIVNDFGGVINSQPYPRISSHPRNGGGRRRGRRRQGRRRQGRRRDGGGGDGGGGGGEGGRGDGGGDGGAGEGAVAGWRRGRPPGTQLDVVRGGDGDERAEDGHVAEDGEQ